MVMTDSLPLRAAVTFGRWSAMHSLWSLWSSSGHPTTQRSGLGELTVEVFDEARQLVDLLRQRQEGLCLVIRVLRIVTMVPFSPRIALATSPNPFVAPSAEERPGIAAAPPTSTAVTANAAPTCTATGMAAHERRPVRTGRARCLAPEHPDRRASKWIPPSW